jgi:hypothetical protein
MTGAAEDTEAGYRLLVSFPDQSPSFTYGFEAGCLWTTMRQGGLAEIAATTRVENREVIRRMADHLGYALDVEPTETEGWDDTTLMKIKPARERVNPHGLRVVKED